jgi:tetrahydromethanopterin S-methyltransferase subunit D
VADKPSEHVVRSCAEIGTSIGVGAAPLEVGGAAGQQVGLMAAAVLLSSAESSSILLVDDALDCVEDARTAT